MSPPVRLDKWLWCVRLFKTRTQAAEAVRGHHVLLEGKPTKPAHELHGGEQLRVRRQDGWYLVRCLAAPPSRVGAALVGEYVEVLERPDCQDKLELLLSTPRRAPGTGRPNRQERRQHLSFFGE